jgi:hypothetical protein
MHLGLQEKLMNMLNVCKKLTEMPFKIKEQKTKEQTVGSECHSVFRRVGWVVALVK